jgi:hypothetical protein
VTLRNVEPCVCKLQRALPTPRPPQARSAPQAPTDADIIAWFRKVQRYNDHVVPQSRRARTTSRARCPVLDKRRQGQVQSRMLSLLAGQGGVKTLDLPKPAAATRARSRWWAFRWPGLPCGGDRLAKAGCLAARRRHGDAAHDVVRTSALVTNLGVHFKLGRENALAWVTTLDKGQPVAGATVQVSDCRGNELATP